ncbi:hypothetical protein H6G89_11020 [Oscillatoria sp. FACHB-1407]|nr:hypothetical protein [Oscillatoria sp. FACHB-1407]MBD2461581.1 hypothetical protein [Oscillatoria sp. FACHB-1407]
MTILAVESATVATVETVKTGEYGDCVPRPCPNQPFDGYTSAKSTCVI